MKSCAQWRLNDEALRLCSPAVFEEVGDSLRQHLKRLLKQREDRWLYAGIIVIAANAGTKS
jgi:hypothetical protein